MRFFFLLLLLMVGCQKAGPKSQNLVVAASLGPAANEVAARLSLTHGLKINVQAGASSLIARQISAGLPCDVVILADDDWMDYLSEHKAIDDSTRRPFLGNRLVWIANILVKEPKKSGRVAMADPDHVPAGKYAKAALLAQGTWSEVSKQMVSAPDVRTALLWVERGEVDSGIVYESDAMSSKKVKIISRFEESLERPIRFPIAQCRTNSPHAKELYRLLTDDAALEVFRNFGFSDARS